MVSPTTYERFNACIESQSHVHTRPYLYATYDTLLIALKREKLRAVKGENFDGEYSLRIRIDLPGDEGEVFDQEFYIEDDESDYDTLTYLIGEIKDNQMRYHGVDIEEEWYFGLLIMDCETSGIIERRYVYINCVRR